ncbi:hypothetical protein B0T26DRAFT_657056 [Lasiosphaeria miniovina]|uniref:Glucosamine 6-phosphate N-acetyltransferase n=1 Tax=Lasiosphaeria miniovina TaxID=1954250 RepID=A0AA40DN77_9PEZI|nr:uncharacterized protein B0T26DRAFT_657056 [Lasiosphaeria miniovina]KAK0706038.1 hypothetical protein B0T26DRAFT_657056 [Lasiosphaeria miniovina]
MGTPFISLLEPTLLNWDRSLPSSQQPASASLPRTFLDAMEVREQVYVTEQGVPQENEFDLDDSRSCHWVIYASVNIKQHHHQQDNGLPELNRSGRQRSETRTLPIGTIRLVPFPHPPHPRNGGVYADWKLTNAGAPVSKEGQRDPSAANGNGNDGETVAPLTANELERHARPLFGRDQATEFHDGAELYVKLGRLAVLKEFRGRGIAGQLVRAALGWAAQHGNYFNPSVAALGLDHLGGEMSGEVPMLKWRGLLCCHAQEDAVKFWEKAGFAVDKKMGRWLEDGIPHVGMFQRLTLEPSPPQI